MSRIGKLPVPILKGVKVEQANSTLKVKGPKGELTLDVAPGGTDTSQTFSVNSAEQMITPALGAMVLTYDNKAGAPEAQLIPLTAARR